MPRKLTEKSKRIFDHLSRVIAQSAPHSRLPSVRALMTRFNVSQATVTAAINQLEQQGALYRKQSSGLYSSERSKSRPALLLVDSGVVLSPSSFWSVLISAIQDLYVGSETGLDVRFTHVLARDEHVPSAESFLGVSLFEAIHARKFAGVYSLCQSDLVLDVISQSDLPSVGFACAAKYHIHMAYSEACQLAVSILASLGCKRLSLYRPSHVASREVFLAGLRMHGLEEIVPPTVAQPGLFRYETHYRHTIELGFRAAIETFGPTSVMDIQPDGVVILDDIFAQGFLMGLQSLNVGIGDQVHLATHANLETPTLLAWQENIISLGFSALEIAATMYSAMESLTLGQEPASAWEHASWNHADRGPFRVAMVSPLVSLPKSLRV